MAKQTSPTTPAQPLCPTPEDSDQEATAQAAETAAGGRRAAAEWLGKATEWLPAALGFLASLNVLRNDFVSDDAQQVLNNLFIRDLKNLPLAFTTSVWSFATTDIAATAQPYFRPMFSALFTVNYAIFGTASPVGWHLVNVLIHTTVTGLAYVTCKELSGRRTLALIAATLFAVHPVHTESVAWVSGVTDPLMALFLMPSFYFYLLYRKTRKRRFMGFTLLLFLFALWSKETAFALPLVIAYCELFHFKDAPPLGRRLKRLVTLAAVFVV